MNFTEIIRQYFSEVSVIDFAICLAGVVLFSIWLLKTSLGRTALADSGPRHNNIPVYMPFVPVLICFGTVPPATSITRMFLADSPEWHRALADNLILCICATAAIAVTILTAKVFFVEGLKGFGLNLKTIGRDFLAGVVNLLSIWPILLAAILLTSRMGQLVFGEDFQMEKHEALKTLTTYPQWPVNLSVVISAVVVAPIFEETVFRGLFQSVVRRFLPDPWIAILIAAGIFALAHANLSHWPALFVLGVCMGYSYEKSGSLWRPIFIHAVFNATGIVGIFSQ